MPKQPVTGQYVARLNLDPLDRRLWEALKTKDTTAFARPTAATTERRPVWRRPTIVRPCSCATGASYLSLFRQRRLTGKRGGIGQWPLLATTHLAGRVWNRCAGSPNAKRASPRPRLCTRSHGRTLAGGKPLQEVRPATSVQSGGAKAGARFVGAVMVARTTGRHSGDPAQFAVMSIARGARPACHVRPGANAGGWAG